MLRSTSTRAMIDQGLEKARDTSKDMRTQLYEDSDRETQFYFQKPLGDRGQTGLAGFYTKRGSSDERYLIKEDDPATCLLEGAAYFAESVIPESLRSSVNFAHAGTGKVTVKVKKEGEKVGEEVEEEKEKEIAVSIQREVSGYEQWPKVIAGKEGRNPKS